MNTEILTTKVKVILILSCCFLLFFVIYLTKRRKLREDYALFWIGILVIMLILSASEKLLLGLTKLIGAKAPVSALFFLGMLFFIILSLYFSSQLSKLRVQIKKITQKLALLEKSKK